MYSIQSLCKRFTSPPPPPPRSNRACCFRASACLQRFQLISLSALLFAALALVTPSDKAFGQTTSIDLDILNVFYDPGSKDLIIVFNEGIDPDSVELSRFRFPRTITIPVQPLTSFEHDVNGNTLTVSLSSAVSDRLDEAIGDSAITIPSLVSDADAVNATDDRGGEPLAFSGFAGDALTILTAGAVPPPVVDSDINLDSTSQPRTLTVSGNGITGQSIELFDRGTSAGTTTVDNNGFWEIIVELARTTEFVRHTFTATATDSDSNTSARSNSESLGVDGEMNRSPTVNTGFGDGGLDLLLRLDSSSITLDLSNLYADPDGDPLTITFDNLNSGLITTNGSRITFRSATQADFPLNGMITFAVIVSDGLAFLLAADNSNQLPFTVQINPDSTGPVLSASNVDQTLFDALIVATNAPTTSGLAATLAENTPHTFAAGQFNFADEDGDALHSLRIDTLPATGSLALSGAAVTAMQVIPAADIPNLVYTPATDATGTVTFTYSLSDGTEFSEPPATATLTITSGSAPPASTLTITGTPTEGQTLTVNTAGIRDSDGLNNPPGFTYQWNRHDGGTDTTISGATSATYLLVAADIDQRITVTVSYTDMANNPETMTSAPVGPVIAAPAPEVLSQDQVSTNSDDTSTTITLPTSEDVDVTNAAPADFTVTSTLNGDEIIHTVESISTGSIVLVVTPPIPAGSEITIAYTPNAGSITNTAGKALEAFTLVVRPPGAFTDLNETTLPEVARALADQTVSGITQRIDQVRDGANRSLSFGGQSSLAGVASAHGKGMVDGSLDMKAMLANSGFALPLNATDGTGGIGSGSLTFWGGGDYRDFDGSGNDVDFDGDLFSAQLGVDGKLRDDLLIGVAASWSESDIDYRDDSGRGEHQLEIASVNPYASWETASGLELWATVGYGQGDLEITADGQDRVSSDVETRTLGAGVDYQLQQRGSTSFRLKGSAVLSELEVKGSDGIAALEVNTSLLRMTMERSSKRLLSGGAYMEPSLEAGARYDGGDGGGGDSDLRGLGAELGAGLRYTNPAIGLTLEGNARTLVGRDDYKEWGVSGRIFVQPGRNGRGPSFSLKPVYGRVNSGLQALWNDGLDDDQKRTARDNTMRMESRLGYGLSAPGGYGLMTPYAEMTSGQSTRRYRLGMNWEAGSLFDLNLVGERSESSARAEHAILLKGVIWL